MPNTATALAAEFPSHESTEPEISADEDLEEFRPRVTINSQNPNRSRRTRSQGEKADQGDKTNQRGSRKSNRGQSNGLSGVKETMKRVGKQNAVARSSDPLSAKRPVSPKRPPARRAVTAKALPGIVKHKKGLSMTVKSCLDIKANCVLNCKHWYAISGSATCDLRLVLSHQVCCLQRLSRYDRTWSNWHGKFPVS